MIIINLGILFCILLLFFGACFIKYQVFYNVQSSKYARQKRCGIWYYVSYVNLKCPDCAICDLLIYEWSRSDKAIGNDFKILETENYN